MVTVVVPMVHYGHSAPRPIYILKWHSLIPFKINILVLTPWQWLHPTGVYPLPFGLPSFSRCTNKSTLNRMDLTYFSILNLELITFFVTFVARLIRKRVEASSKDWRRLKSLFPNLLFSNSESKGTQNTLNLQVIFGYIECP